MIGKTIRARGKIPFFMCLMTVVAVALGAAAALGGGANLGMAAVLPGVLAALLWLARPGAVELHVEEEALQVVHSGRSMRYDEIVSVWVGPRPLREAVEGNAAAGPIYLGAPAMQIVLPEVLDVVRGDFLSFLYERVGDGPPPEPPQALADHVAGQTEKFGAEQITVIRQQARPKQAGAGRGALLFGVAAILSGVTWLVATNGLDWITRRSDQDLWEVVGILGIVVGVISLLIGYAVSSRGRQFNKLRGSCIVISPGGIAVVQGDVRGAMSWEEITQVENHANSLRGKAAGITIKVAGGRILIPDIYACSSRELAAIIQQNRGA